MADTCNWLGHSFNVHKPPVNWSDKPGVYIFCGINQANEWVPLYIGQASSLVVRLAKHERWQEASTIGATHIHATVVRGQADRDQLESRLIQSYQPRLNVQLR